jgi:hypothetical protein
VQYRWIAIALAVACSSDDPQKPRRLNLPFEEPTGEPVSTAVRKEPRPPVTAASLVEEGKYWRLVTSRGPVHVWTPKRYRPKRATTIVYVHGYYVNVDQAWDKYHLPVQFAAAGIDAMFIAPEAPAGGDQPVSWTSLGDLLAEVEKQIDQPMPGRRTVAVGHSGAYRTLLHWLADPALDTVVLLDAAYGEIEQYRKWITADDGHRLINVGDLSTREWTDKLHASLPDTVVLENFPSLEDGLPREAARARILYIKSTLGHFPLVTGGIALPMILRSLRAPRVLRKPLADLVE